MSSITPSSFIAGFKDFISIRKVEIINCYHSDRDRTIAVIGRAKNKGDDCHLGMFLIERFPEYGFRREDGSIDLSVYKIREPYRNVFNLWFNHKKAALNVTQPVYYDVLIEVENKLEHGFQEMAKLTYYNSALKVLILWLWHSDDLVDDEVHPRLTDNFRTIIKTTNQVSCENPDNTYLLVTIQLVKDEFVLKFTTLKVADIIGHEKI